MPPLLRLFLSVPLLCALSARAETTLCTEITPPTTITQAGVYCLFKDYALNLVEGAAIAINANNVVLDFNGHRIGNGGAGAANAAAGVRVGFSAGSGYQNVAIRNGTILGFRVGLSLDGASSQGHLVEDMLIDRSLEYGIYSNGNRTVLRRNRIVGTGTTSTTNGNVSGLSVLGDANVVADNDVLNTAALKSVYAMYVLSNGGAVIAGNRVLGLAAGAGWQEVGIAAYANAVVSGNTVVDTQGPGGGGTTRGFFSSFGHVKFLNNAVSVVGIAYDGGTQIAGTNH